jgi:large subunit ribosomal protein L30
MANSKLTLIQVHSPIGRKSDQRGTFIGLGLNKMNRKSILDDTPSIRGMVAKVKHLVKVIEEN